MPLNAVLCLALAASLSTAGFVGIAWCRGQGCPLRARWGRRLFLGMLLALGLLTLWVAGQPHQGLIYLGLGIGSLVITMLWDRAGPELPPALWDEAGIVG